MSMCSVFSPVAGREVCKSVSLCPVSFCTPRPNLPVTPGISWLPTFAFQSSRSPCPWWWFISNLCVELGLESRTQETSWLSLENPKIPEAWAGRGCGESLILYLLPLDRWRREAKEGDWLVQKGFPCSMWDLSCRTRDWTRVPCSGKVELNHWTAWKSQSPTCRI